MTIVNLTPPYQQFYDDNGNPLSGGLVYSYTAGTLTPLATYTDQGGGTPNANPVVLDSAGRADIWLNNASSYKFIVKTSTGTTIRTVDNITPFNTASGLSVLGSIAANTMVGNNTGATATPVALTATQAQANMINNLSVVAIDTAADYVPFYDTSGATAGKALASSIIPSGVTVKAWVFFTVSGGTYTAQASSGYTSFAKTATGKIEITWTATKASTNYMIMGCAGQGTSRPCVISQGAANTTTKSTIWITDLANTFDDPAYLGIAIIGT